MAKGGERPLAALAAAVLASCATAQHEPPEAAASATRTPQGYVYVPSAQAKLTGRRREPEFGPEERLRGSLTIGFETSVFRTCWFETEPGVYQELARLAPEIGNLHGVRLEVEIMGRRTLHDPARVGFGRGYGHMSMFSCIIRATRIISARTLHVGSPTG